VAVAVCMLVAADKPSDAVKKEMAKLNGEFSMVSAERDGMAVPDELVKTGKRVTKNGETNVSINGNVVMKAKFTIDPTKKPKTIDYTILEGGNKDQMVPGIHEIDGDTIKFCFSAPGKDRPMDFTAKEGSGRTLSTWKRDKK
jgi:uncharacterized protein (TIGR03067 family)